MMISNLRRQVLAIFVAAFYCALSIVLIVVVFVVAVLAHIDYAFDVVAVEWFGLLLLFVAVVVEKQFGGLV